ncbi:glycosyltransferase [Effusibacillus consociatus]|uniref:Glycosyltransferase n=1 Tax=Effusibacillus consociatus TaxID=1117041 RepID=A0ABV9PXC0_9BACL
MKQLNDLVERELGEHWREETLFYVSSGGIGQSYDTVLSLKPKQLVFDILDDNLGFPGMQEEEKAVLENQFKLLLTKATLVTAVSEYLVKKTQTQYSIPVEWLPNGVEIERFGYQNEYGRPLEELKDLSKPLFGFVGALTSWIDFELLLKIADHPKTGTLVLVGPLVEGAVPADLVNQMKAHPKIKFLGSKPYDEVPHVLHQFDVLLLPRNYEPHSLASDPLKLYEYMATGKPIVSTALPSALRFSRSVFVGSTHQDFLSLLERAEEEWSEQRAAEEIALVQSLSWKSRAHKLIALVEKHQNTTC